MKLSEFDYHLPPERIAQTPAEPRDASRLMHLNRQSGAVTHHQFRDILDFIQPNDVLVLNQTRVIPARLTGIKTETGGAIEILLLKQLNELRWRAIVGGRRLTEGVRITIQREGIEINAEIEQALGESQRIVRFAEPINEKLDQLGEAPLPPYITTQLPDAERYQTVYSHIRASGSAAAPTAGLHFTSDILFELHQRSVKIAYCTLHIGLDTFAPVKVDNIAEHQIHRERAVLTAEDAKTINDAKLAGGRIIAVGTTSTRTLETAAIRSMAFGTDANIPADIMQTYHNLPDNACPWRPVIAIDEETNLFITPGYQFRTIDAMLTNFHLPKSTLLMMISAFAGRENVLNAYRIAIENDYRFYSLGDAMLIGELS